MSTFWPWPRSGQNQPQETPLTRRPPCCGRREKSRTLRPEVEKNRTSFSIEPPNLGLCKLMWGQFAPTSLTVTKFHAHPRDPKQRVPHRVAPRPPKVAQISSRRVDLRFSGAEHFLALAPEVIKISNTSLSLSIFRPWPWPQK